jgi:hypothetical protein
MGYRHYDYFLGAHLVDNAIRKATGKAAASLWRYQWPGLWKFKNSFEGFVDLFRKLQAQKRLFIAVIVFGMIAKTS